MQEPRVPTSSPRGVMRRISRYQYRGPRWNECASFVSEKHWDLPALDRPMTFVGQLVKVSETYKGLCIRRFYISVSVAPASSPEISPLHERTFFFVRVRTAKLIDMSPNSFLLKGLLAIAAVSSVAANKITGTANYVIVGGGPAGFVVAEQLSRNPRVNVTLLEAGPDGSGDSIINGNLHP